MANANILVECTVRGAVDGNLLPQIGTLGLPAPWAGLAGGAYELKEFTIANNGTATLYDASTSSVAVPKGLVITVSGELDLEIVGTTSADASHLVIESYFPFICPSGLTRAAGAAFAGARQNITKILAKNVSGASVSARILTVQ
jgi:hypothetical protein